MKIQRCRPCLEHLSDALSSGGDDIEEEEEEEAGTIADAETSRCAVVIIADRCMRDSLPNVWDAEIDELDGLSRTRHDFSFGMAHAIQAREGGR